MAKNKRPIKQTKREITQQRLGFPSKTDGSIDFTKPLYDSELNTTIVGVEWERFYLFLDIESEKDQGDLEFFFVISECEGLVGAKFKEIKREGNRYRVMIDITNDGSHRCVRPESYYIYALANGERWNEVTLSASIGKSSPSWTRLFPYNDARQEYVVFFDLDKNSDKAVPMIRIQSAVKYQTDILDRDKHTVYSCIRDGNMKLEAKREAIKAYYRLRRKQHLSNPSAKPGIVFVSEQDDHLRGNLLALYNRMIERGIDEHFDIRTACREAVNIKMSKESWLEVVDAYAHADFMFVDDYNPLLDWLHIDESTQIIQLWHAGAGFKAAGYARWGRTGAPRPYCAHRQYSYGISGSNKIRHFFSEVFGINEERILPTGMPRMDEYLDPEHRKQTTAELYEQFPIAKEKKVILFAPTYRGLNKPLAMYPYEMIDFDGLYDACGDEWVVLYKMHPWVDAPVPIPEKYGDKMIDASKYPDINNLFYITDLLISDYSSNIFEYSLMRNPMLFYAFDELEYSFARGFHRPYEESVPGKICRTSDELIQAIRSKDFEGYKVDEYVEHHFDRIDSHASDRVIDWIVLGQMPNEVLEAISERNKENERIRHLLFDRCPLLIERDGYAVDDNACIVYEWTPEKGPVSTGITLKELREKKAKAHLAERAKALAAETPQS